MYLANNGNVGSSAAFGEIGRGPEMPSPEFLANARKGFFPNHAARNPLEAVDQGRDRNGRGELTKTRKYFDIKFYKRNLRKKLAKRLQ